MAGVQGVAGVLEDLTGATSLALLTTQAADEEKLGRTLSQRGFGRFVQDLTAPLLPLVRRQEHKWSDSGAWLDFKLYQGTDI